MIITIAGMAGSGKSTIAKMLAKKLKLKHFSGGDLQRMYAKEKGIAIHELGELEAKDDTIDKEVDAYQTKLKDTHKDFVIDSWLGFHFIKNSIKIFLDCDEDTAVKRIFNDKRDSSEKKTQSLEETKKIRKQRMNTNKKRWLKYYQIDFLKKENYDLIIDTTNITPDQIITKILNFINKQ